jgi:hypothetical protein
MMKVVAGKGYLLHTAQDGPYAGWVGVRHLDATAGLPHTPWEALRNLADLTRLLPGGLALLWDAPVAWLTDLPAEIRTGFWKSLCHLPGLSLHFRLADPAGFEALIQESLDLWQHGPAAPTGGLGLAWRQGWLGWIPEPAGAWTLPGLGVAEPGADDQLAPGFIWGELLLPLGALEHLDPADLATALGEAQALSERALSQRLGAHAWPAAFPFHRRRTGWRVAFLGGREFQLAGGSWPRAATLIRTLAEQLETALHCPIHLGASNDPLAAAALGQQAMAEGLPWRNALPMPPAAPAFSTGLGAPPREPAPLESRCGFPPPLAALLRETPCVTLRVPAAPMEGAVTAFLAGLQQVPAIRWLPPELPPPGPFTSDGLWAPAAAFPPLADASQMLQPSLFEDF